MKHKNARTVLLLLLLAVLIAALPLFLQKGASFGGTDDAGSQVVEEIQGKDYKPWFTPVLDQALGGELPEVESLLFCVQTGIGVGVIAFLMGRLVERRKWMRRMEDAGSDKARQDREADHASD